MKELRLGGVLTALVTPFREDGGLDEAAYRSLVERQIAGGVSGLVPCGTTGESATMTEQERARVISLTVEVAAGRVPVIAGTGSNDTARTVRETRRAQEGGADAALVVTPYYNKPTPAGLEKHYRTVADEGGLPVVVYNVPGRTGTNITPDVLARLWDHPRIIALKEAARAGAWPRGGSGGRRGRPPPEFGSPPRPRTRGGGRGARGAPRYTRTRKKPSGRAHEWTRRGKEKTRRPPRDGPELAPHG